MSDALHDSEIRWNRRFLVGIVVGIQLSGEAECGGLRRRWCGGRWVLSRLVWVKVKILLGFYLIFFTKACLEERKRNKLDLLGLTKMGKMDLDVIVSSSGTWMRKV